MVRTTRISKKVLSPTRITFGKQKKRERQAINNSSSIALANETDTFDATDTEQLRALYALMNHCLSISLYIDQAKGCFKFLFWGDISLSASAVFELFEKTVGAEVVEKRFSLLSRRFAKVAFDQWVGCSLKIHVSLQSCRCSHLLKHPLRVM
jgi:hypothetical protein